MAQTLENALRDAVTRLAESGATTPRLDAELLMMAALGIDRLALAKGRDEPMPEDSKAARAFQECLERRRRHEPVAYILGYKEFWDRRFKVTPDVLIPRPETELLVEVALGWLEKLAPRAAARRVLDVGTGSGAIGVTLVAEAPNARVVCSDICAAALAVARENALTHGVASRIEFVQADAFEGIADKFDLIVSNPPYVADQDRDALMPGVRDYEPARALFSGPDGLAFIKRLLCGAPDFLKSHGAMILEIGYNQGAQVLELIAADPRWRDPKAFNDGAGYPRVIMVQVI